ncbi:MAG: 8-amino-7-oxononanoate synthase [Chitinophagaceae bacterium]|nr:8-amino-7-oxononanoate synthase [Chitinophagaceae bacterium]
MTDDFLKARLAGREQIGALRKLRLPEGKIDFSSNDYLGLSRKIQVADSEQLSHGSTGSRLLAGNYTLINEAEQSIARFHGAESGLIFNSGYDANLGLLSAVPQRGDTILYDYLSHASIRDGIRLSFASSFSFVHNDLDDLETKLQRASGTIFVVTESVFSMDGDQAPLKEIADLCDRYSANLIIDEAHATGIIGDRGEGLVQQLQLSNRCFARVHTFGKALGCHGAIVVGSNTLRDYLTNFARSFVYTTALPETAVAAIRASYQLFPEMKIERHRLNELTELFATTAIRYDRVKSITPIQAVIVPGNKEVKAVAQTLQTHNLDVRPILYPTVPKGSERLRIVLHSFNTHEAIRQLLSLLQ